MITRDSLQVRWEKLDDEIILQRSNINATLDDLIFRSRMDKLIGLLGKMELLLELMNEVE